MFLGLIEEIADEGRTVIIELNWGNMTQTEFVTDGSDPVLITEQDNLDIRPQNFPASYRVQLDDSQMRSEWFGY